MLATTRAMPEGTPINGSPFSDAGVYHYAFHPAGTTLAMARYPAEIQAVDLSTGSRRTLYAHKHQVTAMSFGPDGRWLNSSSYDTTVKLWDVKGARLAHEVLGHKTRVNDTAFAPDGQTLASCSQDGILKLRQLRTRSAVSDVAACEGSVHCVQYSPNGRLLAACGDEEPP